MKNGLTFEVEITSLDHNAQGVAHINEYTLHLENCAPGDIVLAQILHISPHRPSCIAKCIKILKRGPHWNNHFCPHILQKIKCGGCPLGHLTAEMADKWKKKKVIDTLLSDLDCPIKQNIPTIRKKYRNRSNYIPFFLKGNIFLGSYSPGTHKVAKMNQCSIVKPAIRQTAENIEIILNKHSAQLYPKQNSIRYISIRSFYDDSVLVEVIIFGESTLWLSKITKEISHLRDVCGIITSKNETNGNSIRATKILEKTGEKNRIEKVGKINLKMGASTFFQLNTQVATQMYELAASSTNGTKNIFDLYCGIGGLGLYAAKINDEIKIEGADFVKDSIEIATQNASLNQIEANFKTLDLSSQLPNSLDLADMLIVNPPRKGLDNLVLSKIKEAPKPFLYMSCNPESFIRDALCLARTHKVIWIEAFDMLPWTLHVELLAQFIPQ